MLCQLTLVVFAPNSPSVFTEEQFKEAVQNVVRVGKTTGKYLLGKLNSLLGSQNEAYPPQKTGGFPAAGQHSTYSGMHPSVHPSSSASLQYSPNGPPPAVDRSKKPPVNRASKPANYTPSRSSMAQPPCSDPPYSFNQQAESNIHCSPPSGSLPPLSM